MRQPRKVLVIDDFYENPDKIRDIALSATYSLEGSPHFIRSAGYFSGNMLPLFEDLLGISINLDRNWTAARQIKPEEVIEAKNFNGTFYKYSSKASATVSNHIHHDCHDWVGVLMLSPECPAEYGTSLWEHKETQKSFTSDKYAACSPPDPICNTADKNDWREVDFIEYKYNRLVLYNGKLFHSANFDPNIERINQLFCFNEA